MCEELAKLGNGEYFRCAIPAVFYIQVKYTKYISHTADLVFLNLGFVGPCIFTHSSESNNQMQQLITGLLFVVEIPLNMFWASLCPSSGAYPVGPTTANSTATTTFLR
jgi:hypothetical protein